MANPQPGITASTQSHHHALEYTLDSDSSADSCRVRIRQVIHALGRRHTLNHVTAFGPTVCDLLTIAGQSLAPFRMINGKDGTSAPATQHDLLIWVQGENRGEVFDAVMEADQLLPDTFHRASETPGFIRAESRDLTGFVDGSANPKGDLIEPTAFLPDHHPGAWGSYVLTQKWRHDLAAFNELGVPEQERVIGRTKPDSIELEGDDMPVDSHVSRTDVTINGETQRIYRRSFPYGTLDEHGLYFLAFACDQNRFDLQLRRMYGVTDDDIRDRITDFSTAVTGSYYFAPSADALREI